MDGTWGIIFGLLIGIICWIVSMMAYKRYLVLAAQQRTPVCINRNFYYIVSEHDYNARRNHH